MAGEIQLNSVTLATESGGVASIDSSVNIKGPLNASGSAPIYACRGWVNFNGTGTVAIRASQNVSSITDHGGEGDYTVNLTTAMPDANYIWVGGGDSAVLFAADSATARTTTAFRVRTLNTAFTLDDYSRVECAIFR